MKVLLVLFFLYSSLLSCDLKRGYTGYWSMSWEKGTGDVKMYITSREKDGGNTIYSAVFLENRDVKIEKNGDRITLYFGKSIFGYDRKNNKPIYYDVVFNGTVSDDCSKLDLKADLGDGKSIDMWFDYNETYQSLTPWKYR